MTAPNKRLARIIAAVPLLLLVPFFAGQLTNAIGWDTRDFITMGTLLLVTGLSCEVVLRNIKRKDFRLLATGSILLVFLLVWGELATSFFRTTLLMK